MDVNKMTLVVCPIKLELVCWHAPWSRGAQLLFKLLGTLSLRAARLVQEHNSNHSHACLGVLLMWSLCPLMLSTAGYDDVSSQVFAGASLRAATLVA